MRRLPRRDISLLIAIIVLGLAMRLIFYSQFAATPFYRHPMLDAKYYDDMAQKIASGHPIQDMAFFMGPLYPYALGLSYAITGHSPDVYRLVQMALGLGVCVLLFVTGRRLFSPAVGLLAALFYALYKPVLFHEQTLLMETPLGFVYLFFLLLVVEKGEEASIGWTLLMGVALGVAALFRGNVLLFLPILTVWILYVNRSRAGRFFSKEGLLKALFLIVGALIAVVPATLHNYLAERDFVLITSNDGINLYIGNNERATGCFEPLPLSEVNMVLDPRGSKFVEEELGRSPLKSSEICHFWRSRAADFISRYPLTFLKLLALKLYFFWGRRELDQIYTMKGMATLMPVLRLPLVTFFLIGPLSLLGLFFTFKNPERKKILIALSSIAYCLSLIPFFITDRYRIPIIPQLCLFASFALVRLFEGAKSRRWREFLPAVALLIFLFILLDNRNYPKQRQEDEAFHNSLGMIYQAEGRYDDAIREYRLGLSFGKVTNLYSNLGNTYYLKNEYYKAIENYKQAIELDPSNAWNYLRLGQCYIDVKQWEEARINFERALSIDPRLSPVPYYKLAFLYLLRGEKEKANQFMKIYLEMQPKDKQAWQTFLREGGGK